MQDFSGQTLKGYELKERIGSGGFGAVYKALQTTIGRLVAIKIILPGLANNPDFIRRFEMEAQVIARLEHPFIVPLFDYWRDPNGAYLVMRWFRGGSLQDALHNGPYEVETTGRLLDQVAGALEMAHRHEVVHRDIKPGNILLDEDGNAYLADFGIAKDLGNVEKGVTKEDAVVGSLDYISPEQARGEPVTPRTDLYSLGVVLYEMLEGQHPFPHDQGLKRLFKHINDPLPDITTVNGSIGEAINGVIQKATVKNPKQRYPDALTLAAAFRDAARIEQASVGDNLVEQLTRREQEVLKLMVEGKSNRQIANELFVEISTVKWYNRQIYSKLGVRSRIQATVRARELNLVVDTAEWESGTVSSASSVISLPEPENPYKGLRAFQPADHRDFFGREHLTQRLLDRMTERDPFSRFLAVVGPSGSGKSSLVKAGLIPALWRGEIPGSEHWFVVEVLPGLRPMDELEIGLTKVAANQSVNIREHLHRDENGLLRVAQLILPNDDSELVVVIDQFEEVFTLIDDDQARKSFLDLLRCAMTDPRSRIRVVVTLRADFYDRPLHYPQFGELMRSRMETVLPLTAQGLEKAISGPAHRVGVTFEEGLIAQIVSEMTYQAGALPLLQYALTELFERRDGRILTHTAYQDIGGAVGALASRAEALYEEFPIDAQESARQMFLRLVTLGEGAEDTRRRTARSELLAISNGQSALMEDIIDTYAEYRLLTLDNDPATRSPTVEVAHEAVLREWERLREWLNVSRDEIRLQRQLARMTEEWQSANMDHSFLVRGSRLAQFEVWAEETELALTPQERAFLEASIAERERQKRIERDRQQREAALKQRATRVLQVLVVVFLVAAVVSGGLALVANDQRGEAIAARDSAATAQAQEASARQEAERIADENQRRALAFAASSALGQEAYEVAQALGVESARDGVLLPDTMRVLDRLAYATGSQYRLRGSSGANCPVWISPDHRYLGLGPSDCLALVLVDLTTSEEVQRFSYLDSPYIGFEISRDNQRISILFETSDGVIGTLWNIETGELLGEYPIDLEHLIRWRFTADSNVLATLEVVPSESEDVPEGLGDTIVLHDAVTYEEIRRFVFEGESFRSVDYSADGAFGTAGGIRDGDAQVVVFDADTGEVLQTFQRENQSRFGAEFVGFSPDNSTLWLSLSDASRTYVIDRSTGEDLFVLDGEARSIPGSHALLHSVSINQWVDLNTGESVNLPDYMGTGFMAVGYDPETFVLDTYEKVEVWDVFGRAREHRILFEFPNWNTVKFSPDGQFVVATGADLGDIFAPNQPISILNSATGAVVRELRGHAAAVFSLDWSPDGRYIASGAWDDGVVIWDAESGEEVHRMVGLEGELIIAVRFTQDSRYVLAANGSVFPGLYYEFEPRLLMWDVTTGELVREFVLDYEPPHTGIWVIETHPFEPLVLATVMQSDWTEDKTFLVNLETGQVEMEYDLPGTYGRTAFSPDGASAFKTGDSEGSITEWNHETGEILRTWRSPLDQDVFTIDVSHDGRYLATGSGFNSQEQSVSLWDVETGELVRRYLGFDINPFILSVEFGPDDSELLVTADDGQVRIFPVNDVSSFEWLQENRYIREFTCSERELYRIEPYCDDQ